MYAEPKITSVIINWNGLDDTIECIESLRKIDYANNEIIVVDNGSFSNEAAKLKERFPFIRIIELKRNLGFAIANNIGIRLALQNDSDYVLLLNNDTVVDQQFLKEMMNVAHSDQKIGILGPKMYFYDNKDKFWYAGGKINMYLNHIPRGQNQLDRGQYDKMAQTDWVAGACMLIRSNVFDQIGLLPREYFLGWEDIDFCIGARKKGFLCVFVPRSRIWHKASVSFKKHDLLYKQVFFGFRNRVLVRSKYLTKSQFVIFLGLNLLLVLPIHVIYYISVYKDPKRIFMMYRGLIAGIKDMRCRKVMYKLQ